MVSYPLEGTGWATVKASADGRHLFVGNFFSGKVVKMAVDSGEWVATGDTGVERSLAGIAEYSVAGAPLRKTRARKARRRQKRRTSAAARKKRSKKRSPKRSQRRSPGRSKRRLKKRLKKRLPRRSKKRTPRKKRAAR